MVETDNPADDSFNESELNGSTKHRSTLKNRSTTESHKNGDIVKTADKTTEKVKFLIKIFIIALCRVLQFYINSVLYYLFVFSLWLLSVCMRLFVVLYLGVSAMDDARSHMEKCFIFRLSTHWIILWHLPNIHRTM